ncbi:MAG: hypothetical protein ABJO27_19195 [Pseudoruegeria sp.]
MLQGKIALLLRLVLFSLAGLLAALPFAGFEGDTGILTIDLGGASKYVVAIIWTGIGGGTFVWSRLIKGLGGIT